MASTTNESHTKGTREPSVGKRFTAGMLLGSMVLGGTILMGCDEDFDPASKLNTVRVLAVQADKPYPSPGETVNLQMLWHDGKAPVDSPRPAQIVWIGGCFNPPGDLYFQCFPQLAEKLEALEQDPSLIDQLLGFGETFSIDIPAEIISGRPTVEGLEPYGLSYVFFAVCAGRLGPAEPGEDGLPFACFDPAGNRLGPDDYVPGYLSLYSYQDRTNANPILNGLEINGQLLAPGDEPRFPKCTHGSCQELSLRAAVDPASAETNTGLVDGDGNPLSEQMWVEYLATAGKLDRSLRLVNDATKGFNLDNGTSYEPPEESGKQYIFAVVRDNRGGVSWVKQGVWFE